MKRSFLEPISLVIIFILLLPVSAALAAPIVQMQASPDEPTFAATAQRIYLPLVLVKGSGCRPGQTMQDPAGDVSPDYADVTSMDSSLTGEQLRATLHLRGLPAELTFNRGDLSSNTLEYSWAVYADVDNDAATGATGGVTRGAEYRIAADHWVDSPNNPIVGPIQDHVTAYVWQVYLPGGSWGTLYPATVEVNVPANTITLAGRIPGITPQSRLFFWTRDERSSGALYDLSPCMAP